MYLNRLMKNAIRQCSRFKANSVTYEHPDLAQELCDFLGGYA